MAQNLRCVVVDDEPLAIEILESYIEQFDNLQLIEKFQNPIKAFEFVRNNPVDVLFMDIQMPKLTGLDILRSLPQRPQVIITTAYRDYALEGFELEVADYLLKPISFDRFVKAISRVQGTTPTTNNTEDPAKSDVMFFKVDKKMVKVVLSEVLYVESQRDYLKIVLPNQHVITRLGITEAESTFPEGKFLRIHRSFIVALDKITSFSQSEIELGDHSVPIGRNYRSEVTKALNEMVTTKE